MQRRGETIFRINLLDALNLRVITLACRVVDFHTIGDELPEVFVGRHHVGVYAVVMRQMGKGAYHVVGLKAWHLNHGDVVGLDNALDVGHSEFDVLGCLVAIGFIFLVGLVAEGASRWVETHGNVSGLLFFEHVLQSVDKAKNCRRVKPSRRESRVAHERIISPENQRIGIEKKKLHFLSF